MQCIKPCNRKRSTKIDWNKVKHKRISRSKELAKWARLSPTKQIVLRFGFTFNMPRSCGRSMPCTWAYIRKALFKWYSRTFTSLSFSLMQGWHTQNFTWHYLKSVTNIRNIELDRKNTDNNRKKVYSFKLRRYNSISKFKISIKL